MSATATDVSQSHAERAYQFTAQLDAFAAGIGDRLNEAYRNVILLLFANIVVGGDFSPGTPVDTGFARNSWTVGRGGPGSPRQPSQPDVRPTKAHPASPVGLVAIDDGSAAIADASITEEIHLTSNCVYMGALEDGHSKQAPVGFVWLAITAGQQIVDQVVAEMQS